VTPEECLALPFVVEAVARDFIVVKDDRVIYKLHRDREYAWTDPEEWVRCADVAYLIVECGYPPKLRIPVIPDRQSRVFGQSEAA
jgi:type I restriction enzyme M protein